MASFEIDRQTINDLGIFKDSGTTTPVFAFFDHTKTIGGQKKLTQMMETPSPDVNVLTSRRNCIKYFYENPTLLEIDRRDLDFIDHYLGFGAKPFSTNYIDAILKGLNNKFNADNDYYVVSQGISEVIKLLRTVWILYKDLSCKKCPAHIDSIVDILGEFLLKKPIENIIFSDANKDLNYFQIANYDTLLRKTELRSLKGIVNIVYELDVYIAVAKAAAIHDFCITEYATDKGIFVNIADLYHPGIKKAVKNDILIDHEKNLVFLTGANMAGKSSFLKALGLAIYLAHIGFPVPASSMQTNVFNGLISTINLSDNISSGYSHYYSEIKRVKETAQKILERNNLFIIFDELFRGTNVKDAYDASLATIGALSAIKTSVFLISTHIVEIAAEITRLPNISFQYFASRIDNGKPIFEYKMKEGVSEETLGFFIFKNEGILEILEKAAKIA
jgi:DNA mismatch repair protein MutS